MGAMLSLGHEHTYIIAPMRGDHEVETICVSNISELYPAIVFSPRCEVLVP
jgi:hypothetical protein